MDAYDRCSNLGGKILPIVLSSMVEAETVSDHPRIVILGLCRGHSVGWNL